MTTFSAALAAAAFVFAGAQAAPALAATPAPTLAAPVLAVSAAPTPAPALTVSTAPAPAHAHLRDAARSPSHRGRAGDPAELSVSGRGVVQATPDVMRLTAGVEVRRDRAGEAFAAAKAAALKLNQALLGAGVAERDLRTNDLSLAADYDKYPKVVGYRAAQGVEALVRDLSRADAVVQAVAGVGEEARLNGISFEVSKSAALVKAARAAAVRDAHDKARHYAELTGRGLGRVLKLEEEGDTSPSRFAMLTEKSGVNPGQGTVTLTVRVVYELT
ncbi:SIMPL domain-containing protein [Sphaerisporangium rhizosphaerae]|uniref:SIMPL domain-containing protein n=1 Tax=Sphaerisporangium rhizosphaerae TaxID=2269375 RepID=A0ABW2P0F9_9ACTN